MWTSAMHDKILLIVIPHWHTAGCPVQNRQKGHLCCCLLLISKSAKCCLWSCASVSEPSAACRFTQAQGIQAYDGLQLPRSMADLVKLCTLRGFPLSVKLAPKVFILVRDAVLAVA